jgi:hypothetical protein
MLGCTGERRLICRHSPPCVLSRLLNALKEEEEVFSPTLSYHSVSNFSASVAPGFKSFSKERGGAPETQLSIVSRRALGLSTSFSLNVSVGAQRPAVPVFLAGLSQFFRPGVRVRQVEFRHTLRAIDQYSTHPVQRILRQG